MFAVLTISVSTAFAQRKFTFKINSNNYTIEEQALNDLFGKAFTDLINQHWTEEKHFSLWTQTFVKWKDAASNYQYSFTTYGDRLSNYNITGDVHYYYLGYDSPGKPAKGNPNKEKNFPTRVNVLTFALAAQIVYYCTNVYVK